ncbi:MAG: hypothetical protein IT427_17915 [Pirellulales bacterium]|nr:hypothetical protein [Pirellulales bacterium]
MKRAQLLSFTLTMAACLAGIACAAAPIDNTLPKPIWFSQLAFSIPYNLSSLPTDQQPAQIQLYVSTDRGTTWKLSQSVSIQTRNFDFRAPAEGEYGFLIREVDRQGHINLEPTGPPQLQVVVDVTPPKLALSAVRAPSGEVRANWQASDPLLNVDSLKVEYQIAGGGWRSVAIDPQLCTQDETSCVGTVNLWPNEASPPPASVTLRAEILDRAGNPTRVQTKTQSVTADATPPQPETDRSTNNRRDIWNDATTRWKAERSSLGPLDRDDSRDATTSNRENADGPPRMARNPNWPSSKRSKPSNREEGQINRPLVSDINPPIHSQMPIADPARETQCSGNREERIQDPQSLSDSPALSGDRQQLRLVNSKSFEMDYEIQSVGPSGIAKVELWGTRDAGHTWTSYGSDDDNHTPMRVNVEGEGLYGFRITVQSGSGLASPLPRSGDPPELLIAVDLTKPKVRITDAKAGTGEHAGALLVHWEAADAGITDRPVTLQYSDNPAGPWSVIAVNLAANDKYVWRPSENAPDQIYLRAEARDEAGNVGVYESREPVSLDRIRPEGRIRGVRPITDSANRVQTYQFFR